MGGVGQLLLGESLLESFFTNDMTNLARGPDAFHIVPFG